MIQAWGGAQSQSIRARRAVDANSEQIQGTLSATLFPCCADFWPLPVSPDKTLAIGKKDRNELFSGDIFKASESLRGPLELTPITNLR